MPDPRETEARQDGPTVDLDFVTARSQRFLRSSAALLALVMMIAASVLIYLERGYAHQRSTFEENTNLLLIEVTHREGADGSVEPLRGGDLRLVRAAVDRAAAERGATTAIVSGRYELGIGIPTRDGRSFTVYGLDPAMAPVLGVTSLRDDVGYLTGDAAGPVILDVPVVAVADGGYESRTAVPFALTLDQGLDARKVEYLQRGSPASGLYVTSRTFQRIAAAMFAEPWPDVERRWEGGDLPMTPLIGAVYVYLPDIDQVEPVADDLKEAGLGTLYGLQAFDGLERSLRSTTVLGLAVGTLLVAGAGAYVLLSWRAYLRLARRDVGILKHWGFDERSISAAYARRLTRTCWVAWLCGLAVSVAAAPVLLDGTSGLAAATANAAVLGVLLLVLRAAAVRWVITPVVRTDVLSLLRHQREFQ